LTVARRATLAAIASLVLASASVRAVAAPASDPPVSYLAAPPIIDGVLDDDLQALPLRTFPVIQESGPANPDRGARYRLAYGTGFLYVFIELDANTLAFRDRAYQNGDGFTLVIAKPEPGDGPTREFYVLACSAVDRRDMDWSRKVFWYYNVDHIFVPVSDDTKVAFHDGDGVISFELLLPWKDVHPYHPWLSEGIGFNLGVVNAVGDQERTVYKVVDDNIGAENSLRRYARLQFESPRHAGDPQTFVRLDRNTISAGETVHARAVTVARSCQRATARVLVSERKRRSTTGS
jgi:hypothetical protein